MNYLLIGVIIFFCSMLARGLKKGLLKSVLFCGTTIIALVISSYSYSFVAKGLREYTELNQTLVDSIENSLEIQVDKKTKMKRADQIKVIEGMNLPQGIKDALIENNNLDIYSALGVQNFYAYIANYISNMIVNGIAYFLSFLLSGILIRICFRVLDFITSIPIIREVDKIGGMLLGGVQGIVGIWIFFLLVTMFGSTKFGEQMYTYINASPILTYLYDNNIILNVITSMSKLLF